MSATWQQAGDADERKGREEVENGDEVGQGKGVVAACIVCN